MFDRSVEFCLTPVELLVSLLFSGLVENEMSFLCDCLLRFYWCGFYRLFFVCWQTLSAFIISSFISGEFSSSYGQVLLMLLWSIGPVNPFNFEGALFTIYSEDNDACS